MPEKVSVAWDPVVARAQRRAGRGRQEEEEEGEREGAWFQGKKKQKQVHGKGGLAGKG